MSKVKNIEKIFSDKNKKKNENISSLKFTDLF